MTKHPQQDVSFCLRSSQCAANIAAQNHVEKDEPAQLVLYEGFFTAMVKISLHSLHSYFEYKPIPKKRKRLI